MRIQDYNKIMEFMEQNFIGKRMKVRVAGEGRDELTYCGRLEDAGYVTVGETLEKRVPEGFDGDIRLLFENLKVTLSGYQLEFVTILDYTLPKPEDSKRYLLANGLDHPMLLELELE